MTYHPTTHAAVRRPVLRGFGQAAGAATADYPASQVQTALINAGFPPGSTGADNNFGTNSQAALHQALQFLFQTDSFTVSADKHTVSMDPAAFAALTAPSLTSQVPASQKVLPAASTSTASRPATTTTPAPGLPGALPPTTTTNWMSILPWVVGGVGLVAIGGYFLYAGRKGSRTKITVSGGRSAITPPRPSHARMSHAPSHARMASRRRSVKRNSSFAAWKKHNPSIAWNVYLHGKLIDTVFNDWRDDAADVKRSLVNHDGYDSEITVRKARKSSPAARLVSKNRKRSRR